MRSNAIRISIAFALQGSSKELLRNLQKLMNEISCRIPTCVCVPIQTFCVFIRTVHNIRLDEVALVNTNYMYM